MKRDLTPVQGIGRRQPTSQSCWGLAQICEVNGPDFSSFEWSREWGRVKEGRFSTYDRSSSRDARPLHLVQLFARTSLDVTLSLRNQKAHCLEIAVFTNKKSGVLSEFAPAFNSPYLLYFVVSSHYKLIIEVDSRTSMAWEKFYLVTDLKLFCIAFQ